MYVCMGVCGGGGGGGDCLTQCTTSHSILRVGHTDVGRATSQSLHM